MGDFVISTARLKLRDFRKSDLPEVIAMWCDLAAATYMDDAPKSATEATEWLEQVIHHNRLHPRVIFNLAITRIGVGRSIGWIGMGPSGRYADGTTYGIGFLLGSDYWGQGYMSEALPAVTNHAFGHLPCTRLAAWCYSANVGSARVLEKAGFTCVRRHRPAGGEGERLGYELDKPGCHLAGINHS